MKACFLLLLFIMCCKITVAQTVPSGKSDSNKHILICTPNRSSLIGQEPLYIIKTHGKETRLYHQHLNDVKAQQIKAIEVLKDSTAIKKYGQAAKYGVIEITLDDEKYPDAYKTILIDSTKKKN